MLLKHYGPQMNADRIIFYPAKPVKAVNLRSWPSRNGFVAVMRSRPSALRATQSASTAPRQWGVRPRRGGGNAFKKFLAAGGRGGKRAGSFLSWEGRGGGESGVGGGAEHNCEGEGG